MNKPLLIVIAGPTASGKTDFAIKLAQHFKTEILSFDSRQCFAELKIGVARPAEQQLQTVPHHFIASHSIFTEMNAAIFEQYALAVLQHIFTKNRIAIAVGGTGLYLSALLGRLHNIPPVPEEIRTAIRAAFEANGMLWLQEKIREEDLLFSAKGEMQNPHRMLRALEVKRGTGRSIFDFHTARENNLPFHHLLYGLQIPKQELHHRIAIRTKGMITNGLIDEARGLYQHKKLQALQTVGYKELFDHFDGAQSLETAIDKVVTHTRQYAKRQITWFNKSSELQWIGPDELRLPVQKAATYLHEL